MELAPGYFHIAEDLLEGRHGNLFKVGHDMGRTELRDVHASQETLRWGEVRKA